MSEHGRGIILYVLQLFLQYLTIEFQIVKYPEILRNQTWIDRNGFESNDVKSFALIVFAPELTAAGTAACSIAAPFLRINVIKILNLIDNESRGVNNLVVAGQIAGVMNSECFLRSVVN